MPPPERELILAQRCLWERSNGPRGSGLIRIQSPSRVCGSRRLPLVPISAGAATLIVERTSLPVRRFWCASGSRPGHSANGIPQRAFQQSAPSPSRLARHNLVPRVAPESGLFCGGWLLSTRSGIFGIAANDRAQFDFRNPSSYLCHSGAGRHYRFSAVFGRRGNLLENLSCLRCNREIEAGQKSVAMYMFAQTVGVRPRQKSSAQRICFCPQCSVSLALGPPPEGALNIAAWQMIRDLVSADPALNEAAWENLRGVVGLLPATGTDGGSRRTAGYFEF